MITTSEAVERFLASLRTRSAPANTIKSYSHDLRHFVQAVPADLASVSASAIQIFLDGDGHHSPATRGRRYSTLCALSLVINALVVWNTRHFERAQAKLLEQGYPVEDSVWQHLSPLAWKHINLVGSYHFSDLHLEEEFRPLRESESRRTKRTKQSEQSQNSVSTQSLPQEVQEMGSIPEEAVQRINEEESLFPSLTQLSLLQEPEDAS